MKTNWYSMVSRIQAHRNNPRPVSYVLGGSYFCGEWFLVSPEVLIPRKETELLVNYIINIAGNRNLPPAGLRVLDLGTGSGNISVILAKRLDCAVYAVDIRAGALAIARRNARMHEVENKIKFSQSDWGSGMDIEPVDIVVSNPPYIGDEEWDLLPPEVKDFEPHIALRGGRRGLQHYGKIIDGADRWLLPGGIIVLEIGPKQAGDVEVLMKGFTDIRVIADQYNNPRMISGVKKNGSNPL